MPDPNQLAQDFVNALASINPPEFERILHPDVGIRIWGCDKVRFIVRVRALFST